MGKAYARGKRSELKTAKLLGGQRVGNDGRQHEDVASDWLAIECKARETLPAWLTSAMRQAEAAACRYTTPRLALVNLHAVGGRTVDDLIIMRAGEFRAWFGEWRGDSEGAGG